MLVCEDLHVRYGAIAALRGVSLQVEEGEIVALIGVNGAGKSTLLRLVGGIGRPDEGFVSVCGRKVGLLELGVGFHTDLTGRENVYINGVIGFGESNFVHDAALSQLIEIL